VIVVLVHWKIKRGSERAFRDHWDASNTVDRPSGMIGEFLSKESPPHLPFVPFPTAEPGCANFYTFGLWADESSFTASVKKYFNDEKPPLPFEQSRRTRHLFRPVAWRRGPVPLPGRNSPGTL
jgi:hypothetical protein